MSNKKTALITGGARGIGLGIARCLAQEGFRLALCGTRTADSVKDAMESLASLGADVAYFQADVSETSARKSLIQGVRERFGQLNALVNNAGVAPATRLDVLETTEESYERVMKINLKGPFFLTQSVALWLIEQKRADPGFSGCIVNVSSISATVASVNRGEYCLSKAGVSMATSLWAARLGEFGLPVYEIRPGIIKTDMTAGVQAKYDGLIQNGLLVQPRWGLPEDVGKAVAMLLRGDLSYSTGQVLLLDGGLTLARL